MLLKFLTACVTLALLGGCESTRMEDEYGEAVRQMINAQTYDPTTLTKPSTKAVEGADPDMVNTAIEVFREHVSRPEDVGQDIVIQVGGQGQ